jgi:hypothetical protein
MTKIDETKFANLNTPPIYISISFIIFILFIILSSFLIKGYNANLGHTLNPQSIISIFISLFFILIITGLCIFMLPSFKELKTLFLQIKNVSYIILFTIFLIFFFRLTPINILNKYSSIIVPLTILISSIAFYKGFQQNYITDFNTNYERIKSMILTFCLITLFILFYQVDPGGIISNNFGYSSLITILIAVFTFIYLIITITLPSESFSTDNLFTKFTSFSAFSSILFILFLIFITITIYYYPGGLFKDNATSTFVMIMLLIISILWSILIISNTFPEIHNNSFDLQKNNLLKRSLLMLFGIIISSLVLFWIVYNLQHLSGTSSVISVILNTLLVLIFLTFVYKTIFIKIPNNKLNSSKNNLFDTIINLIFVLPCLFNGFFEFISNFCFKEYNTTNISSILMLIFAIILIMVYFSLPSVVSSFKNQGGKQLINEPVYCDKLYTLGSYENLNGNTNTNYQYAISCWIFIDAVAPNMNSSYEKYTSILNYGNKPNILYNGKTNTLRIVIKQEDLEKNTNKLIDFDNNGFRILYTNPNLALQKWNNIIINYNGGTLDIFLNGSLVKSNMEVIPYFTFDNLTIGENNGIKGGIQNVVYFNKSLNINNIYNIYHSFSSTNY